jgi:hypothetical protein
VRSPRPRSALAAVSLAVLAALLPAAGAAAAEPAIPPLVTPDCTAVASFEKFVTGELSVTVTAIVTGHCREAEWVTCDVTLIGATAVIGRRRDGGMQDCEVRLAFNGLQATPYVNIGQVGYSASDPAYIWTNVAYTVP